jgi:hypothetical protein
MPTIYWMSRTGTVVKTDTWKEAVRRIREIEGYHGQMIEHFSQVTVDDYVDYLEQKVKDEQKLNRSLTEIIRELKQKYCKEDIPF